MGRSNDLVQGTPDLLILKTISLEPKDGWAIAERIQQGSLYSDLHRLEDRAWIKAKWKESGTARKAGSCSLIAQAQLEKNTANWSRLSAAINLVIQSTQE
jgi:PadR family transcriptional regulator PadR